MGPASFHSAAHSSSNPVDLTSAQKGLGDLWREKVPGTRKSRKEKGTEGRNLALPSPAGNCPARPDPSGSSGPSVDKKILHVPPFSLSCTLRESSTLVGQATRQMPTSR